MNERPKARFSTRAKTAAVALCCTTLAVGGVSAYLTDWEEKTNTFTVTTAEDFDTDGWLTEPEWDKTPEDHTNIVPGQVVTKDPTVTNKTPVDAWMYVEVSIPRANIKTQEDTDPRQQDLFTFEAQDNWVLVGEKVYTQNHVLVYALGDGENPTKPNESGTLFNEVNYVDVADGQNVPSSLDINVTGYMVQHNPDASPAQSAQTVWDTCIGIPE